ncbi:MAG TPA: EscU/YscU/HrcU family type III secretion system export apparatus switch protein, partial [bacterium]|nr:EscU/YscU/HrcU family type III secretion system export apparatus switch protein [bacterium]
MPDTPEYGERTEPATPRKREEARKKGQVSRSPEVNYALILLCSILGLYFMSEYIFERICRTLVHYLQNPLAVDLSRPGAMALMLRLSWETILIFLPFSILIVLAGLTSNLLQVGFMMTGEPLVPKWDRINPISGLSRVFSWRSLAELFKSLAKITAISIVCYITLKAHLPRFFDASYSSTAGILLVFGEVLYILALRCLLVVLLIALVDFAFQRWQFERSLRMSVQEVKEEMKEMYGDPMIKARVRQIQRQMAQRRMMAKVPEAEVVVTNPTHYAVALA